MKIARIPKQKIKILLNEKYLEEVENFKYLGSEVNKDGKIQHEITKRIQYSSRCYQQMRGLLLE